MAHDNRRWVCAPLDPTYDTSRSPTCSCSPRTERAGRDQSWRHVGLMQRVELGPQDVALEANRRNHASLLLGRLRMALDVVEGEIRVTVGLIEAAPEVLHRPLADEVVALEHAHNALAMDGR